MTSQKLRTILTAGGAFRLPHSGTFRRLAQHGVSVLLRVTKGAVRDATEFRRGVSESLILCIGG